MTSGFGVDRSANGLSGTSSQDIRRINGALYTPGIISGIETTTSASAMTYSISEGVVAIPTGVGEIVLAPVSQTTVATPAAPTTGSRTDIIYVKQRFPSIVAEGDAEVVVGVSTNGVLPANSLEIRRYTIPAGITKTNSAILTGELNFSLPYGGGQGVLHRWQNTYSGLLSTSLIREGHGKFTLTTDRLVTFRVKAVLNAAGASGFDNSKYCEWGFLFSHSGGDFVLHTTPGLHQAWATYQFESQVPMGAGTHTVNLGSLRIVGPGQAETHYGVDGQGFGREGVQFTVTDDGPIV